MRNTFDFRPLQRFTIGFDNMGRLFDSLANIDDSAASYPPYNIEKLDGDKYKITMAVAGFSEEELDITAKENALTIIGKKNPEKEENKEYLHKGIADRSFERRFELAAHIKVTGASINNGLLDIELEREVPEELKPRKIAISSSGQKTLEHKKN